MKQMKGKKSRKHFNRNFNVIQKHTFTFTFTCLFDCIYR